MYYWMCIQWNPSKTDTSGTKIFVLYSEVSIVQWLVVDHAPLIIVANYDKAIDIKEIH
jgi:hypothetical protein